MIRDLNPYRGADLDVGGHRSQEMNDASIFMSGVSTASVCKVTGGLHRSSHGRMSDIDARSKCRQVGL